jgi:hypothetical protein
VVRETPASLATSITVMLKGCSSVERSTYYHGNYFVCQGYCYQCG